MSRRRRLVSRRHGESRRVPEGPPRAGTRLPDSAYSRIPNKIAGVNRKCPVNIRPSCSGGVRCSSDAGARREASARHSPVLGQSSGRKGKRRSASDPGRSCLTVHIDSQPLAEIRAWPVPGIGAAGEARPDALTLMQSSPQSIDIVVYRLLLLRSRAPSGSRVRRDHSSCSAVISPFRRIEGERAGRARVGGAQVRLLAARIDAERAVTSRPAGGLLLRRIEHRAGWEPADPSAARTRARVARAGYSSVRPARDSRPTVGTPGRVLYSARYAARSGVSG